MIFKKTSFCVLIFKKYLLLADKYAFILIYHEHRTKPKALLEQLEALKKENEQLKRSFLFLGMRI